MRQVVLVVKARRHSEAAPAHLCCRPRWQFAQSPKVVGSFTLHLQCIPSIRQIISEQVQFSLYDHYADTRA